MAKTINVSVEVGLNDIEKVIKKFSREVRKSGILQEARERKFFIKKSKKRHDAIAKILFYRKKEKKEGNTKKKV